MARLNLVLIHLGISFHAFGQAMHSVEFSSGAYYRQHTVVIDGVYLIVDSDLI